MGEHRCGHSRRVTEKDIQRGQVRVPNDAKCCFPPDRADLDVLLRGRRLRARWDPQDPARSGRLAFGRASLEGAVAPDEVLDICCDRPGPPRLD